MLQTVVQIVIFFAAFALPKVTGRWAVRQSPIDLPASVASIPLSDRERSLIVAGVIAVERVGQFMGAILTLVVWALDFIALPRLF